ncbi:uncharacterized protein LOC132196680 [Neocloeon triangulifer]|uniref:uncharacterized protein LOC132196680 n=1 Tax=Neocloeon triangulifer TaxID=2078957 RepID=UPI00286F3323|nr:uncharacterized protein LOC132196680 [Neocloeon triangulifer]
MMLATATLAIATLSLLTASKAAAKYCDGGHYCAPPKECCTGGCCYNVYTPPIYRPPVPPTSLLNVIFWNHWHFWAVVTAIAVLFLVGCSIWRRRRSIIRYCQGCCYCCQQCDSESNRNDDMSSESGTTYYAPPNYSRSNSFHHSPPPYNEVTAKPDLYPLVISFGGDQGKSVPGSCLMVQYFRNYLVRPVGSLSAASTVDSLNSAFMCADVPPPYPGQAPPSAAPSPPPSSLMLPSCCVTDFGGLSGSEVSSLGLGTPVSPPQATTPTGNNRLFLPLDSCDGPQELHEEAAELRALLDKIQALPTATPVSPVEYGDNEQEVASQKSRTPWPSHSKSGYTPLSQGNPPLLQPKRSRRASWLSLTSPRNALPPSSLGFGSVSSRSAPTTPSTHLAPPLLTVHTGREGSSPLLEDSSEDEDAEMNAEDFAPR